MDCPILKIGMLIPKLWIVKKTQLIKKLQLISRFPFVYIDIVPGTYLHQKAVSPLFCSPCFLVTGSVS